MSEDDECRLSKQAGISIQGRALLSVWGKGRMEEKRKEGQVLTSWQENLSLPPSASFGVHAVSDFVCLVFFVAVTGEDELSARGSLPTSGTLLHF